MAFKRLPEIIDACIKGDDAAWRHFFRLFNKFIVKSVRFACFSVTDSFTEETVEDLIQNVYKRLIKNNYHTLRNFKGLTAGEFINFLKMIAVTVTLDHYRKKNTSKRKAYLESLFTPMVDEASSHSNYMLIDLIEDDKADCPFKNQTVIEMQRQFIYLIQNYGSKKTKEKNRLILKFFFIEGLSVDEIIKIKGLQVKKKDVQHVLSRFRKKFRQKIKKK